MLVDVNVNLSRWPWRRVPCDEPARLVEALRRGGVTQAWTGTLDGLFHRDLAAANARLAEECRRFGPGLLVPFGSIHPLLPDWREDLRRCQEVHGMPGIRLHPNYHGYGLADPALAELFQEARRRRMIVQLSLRMDDARVQNPLFQVDDVDPAPLAAALAPVPRLPLVILNATGAIRRHLGKLLALPGVHLDFAMWEGVGGVAALIEAASPQRVLFGSHLPLFPLESSLGKLRESPLNGAHSEAIRAGNAQRLFRSP